MTNPAHPNHYVDPVIEPVLIDELRPTQITVGRREVEEKRRRWKTQGFRDKEDFVKSHVMPVIRGPKKRLYILDHHHLSLALHEEDIKKVFVIVRADYSKLDREAFWFVLDNLNLMHPFDENGKRRSYQDIPKRVSDLVDDPYRSLAGSLRRAGGYAKSDAPYVEFLWADFLRREIDAKTVASDYEDALNQALELSRTRKANYLPGWAGAEDD
ncbi:ParB-like protein [Labrys neptuniae]